MNTSILRGKLLPFLLLTGLTGCTSSAPTTAASRSAATSTSTAGSSTTTRATGDRPAAPRTASNQPGVGKGHWEIESGPQTGTLVHRRVWVPDDGSGPVTEGGGAARSYGVPTGAPGFLGTGNGRGPGGG